MAIDYYSIFRGALDALPAGATIDLDALLATSGFPKVSDQTKKKYLRNLVKAEPGYLERIVGFYPAVDTVIDLVETRHGKVTEGRLDEANNQCRGIVEKIARPIVHRFVGAALAKHITGASVALT